MSQINTFFLKDCLTPALLLRPASGIEKYPLCLRPLHVLHATQEMHVKTGACERRRESGMFEHVWPGGVLDADMVGLVLKREGEQSR